MIAQLLFHRGKPIRPTVRVLSVRRSTAHIEATRRDGQTVRRFVKLKRLRFL